MTGTLFDLGPEAVIDFGRGDKETLLPLFVWEARIYMSPRRKPQNLFSAKVTAPSGSLERSQEFYNYLQSQFEAWQSAAGLADAPYTWEHFCQETGFGWAHRQREPEAITPESPDADSPSDTNERVDGGPKRSNGFPRKHGLYSKKLVLSPDEALLLHSLRTELEALHLPVGEEERALVNQIAEQSLRFNQLCGYEAETGEPWSNLKPQIRKLMKATQRTILAAKDDLRELQKAREFEPDGPRDGPKSMAEAAG